MPFLDDLLGIKDVSANGGAAVVRRDRLNFLGDDVSVTDNPVTGATDVAVSGGAGLTYTFALIDAKTVLAFGNVSLYRLSSGVGGAAVSGIAIATAQRKLFIVNVGTNDVTLDHEDTFATDTASRLSLPASANHVVARGDLVELVYDTVSARWRMVS